MMTLKNLFCYFIRYNPYDIIVRWGKFEKNYLSNINSFYNNLNFENNGKRYFIYTKNFGILSV